VICDKVHGILRDKRILFLSKTYEGSRHGKAIIDEEGCKLPKGIIVHEDSGFQGHQQKGVIIKRPLKKPKGRELTKRQKASNQAKARKRVRVEHSIGYVKIYRIVKDCIRMTKNNINDKVMELCCGLANFKLRYIT
jgi:hypothetical protein